MLKFERKDPKMLVNAGTNVQIVENKPFINEIILLSKEKPTFSTLNYKCKGKLRPEMISMNIIGGNDDLNFTINKKLMIVCNRDFYHSFGITGRKVEDKFVIELDTIPSKFLDIELEYLITSPSKISLDLGVTPTVVTGISNQVETAMPINELDYVEWMGRLVLAAEIPPEIELKSDFEKFIITRYYGVVHCSEISKLTNYNAIFCKSHHRSTTFWRNIPNVSKWHVENDYLLIGNQSFQFSII